MVIEQVVLIVHVLAAIGIIALILIQQGKGADMGASFGSGASQTLFGSEGSGNFLTKSTAMLATLFFATSFWLAVIAKDKATMLVNDGLPSIDAVEQQVLTPADSGVPMSDAEVPVSSVPTEASLLEGEASSLGGEASSVPVD